MGEPLFVATLIVTHRTICKRSSSGSLSREPAGGDQGGEGRGRGAQQIRGDADPPIEDRLGGHGGSLRGVAIGWCGNPDCPARHARSRSVFLSDSPVGEDSEAIRKSHLETLMTCGWPGQSAPCPGATPGTMASCIRGTGRFAPATQGKESANKDASRIASQSSGVLTIVRTSAQIPSTMDRSRSAILTVRFLYLETPYPRCNDEPDKSCWPRCSPCMG